MDYIDRIQVQQQLKKDDVVLLPAAVNDAIDAVNEYTGQAVTSVRFANVNKFFPNVTTYYYEVYAAAYQFGYDEEGNFTYDYVGSPYSDLVKVDLAGGNSDVEQPDDDEPVDEPDYPQLVDGTLTLGEFDGQREDDAAYDGGNWYNSPMAFTYNNSGSQTIYLPSELAAIKGADITSVTFSCFADWSYETYDYNSTARLYLSEVDDEAFRVNPDSGYPEWFAFTEADLVSTEELSLDFATACIEGEDIHITFRLAHPYHYTGKTLLVTVSNDSRRPRLVLAARTAHRPSTPGRCLSAQRQENHHQIT